MTYFRCYREITCVTAATVRVLHAVLGAFDGLQSLALFVQLKLDTDNAFVAFSVATRKISATSLECVGHVSKIIRHACPGTSIYRSSRADFYESNYTLMALTNSLQLHAPSVYALLV